MEILFEEVELKDGTEVSFTAEITVEPGEDNRNSGELFKGPSGNVFRGPPLEPSYPPSYYADELKPHGETKVLTASQEEEINEWLQAEEDDVWDKINSYYGDWDRE